jgi:hypothetical protein
VRARDEGVRTFTVLMLARNHAMMDPFEHLGPVRIVGRAGGTVEIEVAIPPRHRGAALGTAARTIPAGDGGAPLSE